ncbi:DEAD/DEAH box helicase family protein, partial [Acinetobacter baumannii]
LLDRKLERGERRFHVVAPPGAGKTIIGLQIVSRFKCPALILSPNTTIQSQWGQKLELFMPPGLESVAHMAILGTHEDKPLK